MSLILSRRDLDFLLYQWLDVESLCTSPRHAEHSRETFDAALDTYEQVATELFATHNKKSDQNEPHFDGGAVRIIPEVGAALRAFCDAGLMAAGQDEGLGGMQLPLVVEKAGFAYCLAANVATAGYPLLTIGNANLLRTYGTSAQIEAFVRPQMQGRFFGTMCLSEPQAGSSLADITTRADYERESPLGSQYRLRGSKMWISGGEHELSENIVHLVLAKIPGPDGKLPPGVKGISLFVVPKYLVAEDGTCGERNDVALAGLNHKMGWRGVTNCLLAFGEGAAHRPEGRAGAVGYLVGEPGQGLACMFHMMNEARIGIGLSAAALGYTGYLHALDYARNRPQGRAIGERGKGEPTAQVRIVEHADVRRMLLAQKCYAEGGLALTLYCAKVFDEIRAAKSRSYGSCERLELLLDILTPIAKSWPSQWCLAANDLAIQVHGGYGYTREYNVEQFYRDNRLNPIHEGTHGIQALDLLGRKVVMQDGNAFRVLRETIEATMARAEAAADASLSDWSTRLGEAVARLAEVTCRLWSTQDSRVALANASVYLEAAGHVVVAWLWLEQALVAQAALADASRREDEDFHRGKLAAAAYFFRWELPRVHAQLDLLGALDRTTLDMQDAWF